MTVPTYDQFIEPVLRYLAAHPEGARTADVQEAAAKALGLSDEARAERLPSGVQHVYKNRAGWAHDRLKRAGLSTSPKRGFWRLTPEGEAFAKRNGQPLTEGQVAEIAAAAPALGVDSSQGDAEPQSAVPLTESPDERLDSALQELKDSVSDELLQAIMEVSPKFFEVLVLDLLHAMGYGASRTDLQRVGGAGDAGIDGIISLDRLGMEKVYVQAKRWQNTVGRPEVQGFYGALAGQRAKKGVFIATSSFTAQALEYAHSVEGLILVDGAQLADLMIEHGVGVSHRIVKVPKVDSDYSEE